MMFTKRALLYTVAALLFTGCASWFQNRVDVRDGEINRLEVERAAVREERDQLEAVRGEVAELAMPTEERDARLKAIDAEIDRRDTTIAETTGDIEAKRADRDVSMTGALDEQKNRQALLMALLSLGVGGLKFAAGAAAKGVI